MKNTTMIFYWKNFYFVFLLALNGVQSVEAWIQISWVRPLTAGFTTKFSCSSSCSSKCIYTFSINGLKVNGSVIKWTPDGLVPTVEIQCTVLNPETGTSDSTTSIEDIKNPVSVQINPPFTVPTLNQPLNLVCQGRRVGGLSESAYQVKQAVWYKDGQIVTLNEQMSVMEDNATLHFDSLLPSDGGFYQCEATMWYEENTAFSLGYLLSFDPWNVSISGPDTVFADRLIKLTCLTSCTINVDCTVKWQFRKGFPVGSHLSVHGTELTWIPSTPGTFQNFTCVAENKAAGRFAEATKLVEVAGIPLSGSVVLVPPSGLFTMIFSLGMLLLLHF